LEANLCLVNYFSAVY